MRVVKSTFLPCLFWSLCLALLLNATGCVNLRKEQSTYIPTADDIRLVESISQRLALGKKVAWSKYVNSQPVRNAKRESSLLANLTSKGAAYGLNAKETKNFFHPQIAASRALQAELLHDWRRGATLPIMPYQDLRKEIRPQLDALSEKMLAQIATVKKEVLSPAQCKALVQYAYSTLRKQGYSFHVATLASSSLYSFSPHHSIFR